MHFISAKIVRFVDDSQPGWVECEFTDSEGRIHTLRDKVPTFTSEMLDAESKYPIPGEIPCEVMKRFLDGIGGELVRVTTERPCYMESLDGLSEFTVLLNLITERV